MLTLRCRNILTVLLEAEKPLKIKDLARDNGVSARTVKYDLEYLRGWLAEHSGKEVRFFSKPNCGIWMEGPDPVKRQLIEVVHAGSNSERVLHHNERVKYILLFLLRQAGYVTIHALAERLGVSRGTALGDLPQAERILALFRLVLERKAHRGIRIAGTELDSRLVEEYILQSFFQDAQVAHILQGFQRRDVLPEMRGVLVGLVEDAASVSGLFSQLLGKVSDAGMELRFTERQLLGVMFRFCIMAQRMRLGRPLPAESIPRSILDRIMAGPLTGTVQSACVAWGARLEISVSREEAGYVCLPLSGESFLVSAAGNNALDAGTAASELIREINGLTGLPFGEDPELQEGLQAHLADRLAHCRYGGLDPNPVVADVLASCREMFDFVRAGCNKVLARRGIFLTDFDIAYIALHFQASLERSRGMTQKDILVVCSSGRGAARLLKTRLENELRWVHVVGCCSVFHLEQELVRHTVDLVVSVVPVEASCPVVVVNAVLNEHDVQRVQDALKKTGGLARRNSDIPNVLRLPIHFWFNGVARKEWPAVELAVQEVINRGFHLAAVLQDRFARYLTPEAASGLMLHVLLMVKRLAFHSPYTHWQGCAEDAEGLAALRPALYETVRKYVPEAPDGEIEAILPYFHTGGGLNEPSGFSD